VQHAPTQAETLESLLQQIVASSNPSALAGTLRNAVGTPEAREEVLASTMSAGADPLEALDAAQHTIGALFILSARLTSASTSAPAIPFAYIGNFCQHFDPEQARLAPERVTLLAKGIVQRAEALGTDKAAIAPLRDLLTRYAPSLSFLTTIHPIFVTTCATTGFFAAALHVLVVPISQISTTLCPDLHYQDHLIYHYVGGIIFTALKRYAEAAEFFELCASAPVAPPVGGTSVTRGPSQGPLGISMGGIGMGMGMGMGMMMPPGAGSRYINFGSSDPSMFQVEAAKKLLLVQLILHGKALQLPKYTHPTVANLKGTVYNALARVYPNLEQVHAIATKEGAAFAVDDNTGLLGLVVDRAPRWAIRRLTETYLTLSLSEIGRAARMESIEEVRRVVLSMIEEGEIDASIDADGSVSFADEEPAAVSKSETDRALRAAQEQEQVLRRLEREIARSKDYLQKAVRTREEGSSPNWPNIEEDLLGGSQSSRWADEAVY
jgi:COP9 signalosome complex subunit 3